MLEMLLLFFSSYGRRLVVGITFVSTILPKTLVSIQCLFIWADLNFDWMLILNDFLRFHRQKGFLSWTSLHPLSSCQTLWDRSYCLAQTSRLARKLLPDSWFLSKMDVTASRLGEPFRGQFWAEKAARLPLVNFTNILWAVFLYKSLFNSFSVLTF